LLETGVEFRGELAEEINTKSSTARYLYFRTYNSIRKAGIVIEQGSEVA
jgi:hypothetical protein